MPTQDWLVLVKQPRRCNPRSTSRKGSSKV